MLQALIFDFDGLILDTESADLAAWQQVFAAHGCDFPADDWAAQVGSPESQFDPCIHIAAQTGRPVDCESVWARQGEVWRRLTEDLPVLPGVREAVLEARRLGLKCAVASSGARERVERQLPRGRCPRQACAGPVPGRPGGVGRLRRRGRRSGRFDERRAGGEAGRDLLRGRTQSCHAAHVLRRRRLGAGVARRASASRPVGDIRSLDLTGLRDL